MHFRRRFSSIPNEYTFFQQFSGVTVNIPPDTFGFDQTISLRVCCGDGPLLPPHQVHLSPVAIVGPNTVQFKKPIILATPHCIKYYFISYRNDAHWSLTVLLLVFFLAFLKIS